MLFTRCPDCDTTFRVTDEALKKANGQVRCGRCASVFNAYAELQDPAAATVPPRAAVTAVAEVPAPAAAAVVAEAPLETPREAAREAADETSAGAPPPGAAQSTVVAAPATTAETPSATTPPDAPPLTPAHITPLVPIEPRATPAPTPPPAPAADAIAASIGAESVADVVAQIDAVIDENAITGELAAPPASSDEPISAAAVDEVLEHGAAPQANAPLPVFVAALEQPHRSRWWSVAAVVALVALGAQVVNHYRAELASNARIGAWVQRAYAQLGIAVTPNWNVHQYEILDWVATAEPNSRGLGSLKITARIQNRGPLRQPFPAVQLRLKDRWEEAVGGRTFAPAEYLPRNAALGRLMAPGETARAELELVDPGPDAYGFELDVCVETKPNQLTCGNDKVFL